MNPAVRALARSCVPSISPPGSAVLDYFEVQEITLIGMSLGGCLALRAAAFEPRVHRVVAYDVFTDLLDINLRQTDAITRAFCASRSASA